VLGEYHNFMILVRFGFHKIIYKGFGFHFFSPKIYRKHCFMLLPPLKRTFDVLNIQLILLENQQLFFDKLFYWFICACSLLKNIQIVILIKTILVNKKII
jgi:hypothetical protein